VAVLAFAAAPAAGAQAPSPAPVPASAQGFDGYVAAAKQTMMGDPGAALGEASAALAMAHKEAAGPGQSAHAATAQWLQGEALVRLNRLDEAQAAIRAGLDSAASLPDAKLHGQLTMARAEVEAVKGDVQPAMADFQSAFHLFGQAHDARSQAKALQNIGSIYQDAHDYSKVLEYYAQSADIYPDDQVLLISAHNNIGNAYKEMGRYAQSVAEFEKALAIARQMQSPILQVRVLTNLASAEVAAGQMDAAARHLDQAMPLTRDPGASDWQPFVWGVKAQVELKRGDARGAAADLDHVFAGTDLAKTSLLFRDFHEAGWKAYSALGDDKLALAHLTAFKRLDDEARDAAATTNAALMAARFDFANQASRIATLKAGELQRDIALTAVLLAGSVLVGLLLLAGLVVIRRSRNQVRAANGELSVANQALEDAVKARTEFLATTSHEIRTPLNGILGMTQVLLADRSLETALRDKVALVHGAGESMKALVDDILDLSKIETGKMTIHPTEMDLGGLVNDVSRFWAQRASINGVAVTLDAEGAPDRIVEDEARLRQILFNLMSNAVKFTDAGGVRLTVRVEPSSTGERLTLAVADTGIGIPQDRLEDVFESFRQVDGSVTRTHGGSGLGLAISRRLAEAMGGRIGLQSRLGEGSVFTVNLPLRRAALPVDAAPASTAVEVRTLADCRLLLADSNPLSQSLMRAVLAPATRSFETTPSYEVVAAEAPRFDLIVVEGGLLGADAAARKAAVESLAASCGAAKVVVLIAGCNDAEDQGLLAAGAAQVVRKPISAQALADALREGVVSRQAADRPRRKGASKSKIYKVHK
jgi:signal transduction histidine kinase